MLSPEQLAYCADDILKLYAQLENDIICDIVRRICKSNTLTATGIWQINHLQELGTLHSDILKSIAKHNNKTEAELKKLFENAGITATEYDNEIYRANGLSPKSLKVSDVQMQVLEAGYKKTSGNLTNLTQTTAVSSQTSFINACSLAELKVTSGAFAPQQAITDAIKQVAADGIYVIYPSGHRDRLDVAVRRNVMTGLGQTTAEICLANAREFGCDLMEITAHAGARPSHAAWQGQIVSLSGQTGYLSLSDIGYGDGGGFKGYNCRHDWFPYFEGSARMYSQKDLDELNAKNIEYPDGSMHTLYEAEQRQRAMERKIRATKRTLAACDEALTNLLNSPATKETTELLKFEFRKQSVQLKQNEAELINFTQKTGLLDEKSRKQVSSFGKSISQKAVQSNKIELDKYERYHYNKDGNIIPTDNWLERKHSSVPAKYKPFAIIETKEEKGKHIHINRTLYDKNGDLSIQIHSGNHGQPKLHPYGNNGEHHHYYNWKENQKKPNRITGDLTHKERKEHGDIL